MSDVNQQDYAAMNAAIKYSESRLSSLELEHKIKYGRLHGEDGQRESETEEAFLAGVKWARENPIRVEKNPDEVSIADKEFIDWSERNPEYVVDNKYADEFKDIFYLGYGRCRKDYMHYKNKADSLRESLRVAVDALKFYADIKNNTWIQFNDEPPESAVIMDGGDRAKNALAKIEARGNL